MSTVTAYYKLDSVSITSFYVTPKPQGFNIPREQVNFNVSVSTDWKHDEKIIVIHCMVTYTSKETMEEFLRLTTKNIFIIKNYDEVIRRNNQNITVPEELMLDLYNTSINTARGIILAKSENTYLKDVLLGTLDGHVLLEHMKRKQLSQSE